MAMTPRQRTALAAGADYVAARALQRELADQWRGEQHARDTVAALQTFAQALTGAALAALGEALAPEAAPVAPTPPAGSVVPMSVPRGRR